MVLVKELVERGNGALAIDAPRGKQFEEDRFRTAVPCSDRHAIRGHSKKRRSRISYMNSAIGRYVLQRFFVETTGEHQWINDCEDDESQDTIQRDVSERSPGAALPCDISYFAHCLIL